jgi:hypothetical protein
MVFVDKESDPSYLSVCELFEEYFKRMKDLFDYVSLIEVKERFLGDSIG